MFICVYCVGELPVGRLSVMARPRGGDWLGDEMRALRAMGVDVVVSLLTPDEVRELELVEEAEECWGQGMVFLSFPIPDREVPLYSREMFAFLEEVKGLLEEGKHVVLHCRMGLGRVTVMAAGVLVLMGVAPGEALEMLTRARGHVVPDTEGQRAWILALPERWRDLRE